MKESISYIGRLYRQEHSKPFKAAMIATAILLTLIVAYLDYVTDPNLAFYLFYLAPLWLTAWYVGRKAGVVLSFVCTFFWIIADIFAPEQNPIILISLWNTMMGFCFFLVFTLLISSVKSLLDREKIMARSDALTGLCNLRCFLNLAETEVERARRYSHPFTVAYMDVDNFKAVNDTKGHAEGDNILKSISEAIRSGTRKTDVVARIGGDEFAFLFPETDGEGAKLVMSKIHGVLENEASKRNWPVTFSIGVVTFVRPPDTIDHMIGEADKLMYSVKLNGKKRAEFKVIE